MSYHVVHAFAWAKKQNTLNALYFDFNDPSSDRPKPVFDRDRNRDQNVHKTLPKPRPNRNTALTNAETES